MLLINVTVMNVRDVVFLDERRAQERCKNGRWMMVTPYDEVAIDVDVKLKPTVTATLAVSLPD